MLTGLEQYSLERAGYFIRRGMLPAEMLRTAAAVAGAGSGQTLYDVSAFGPALEEVMPVVQDALGSGALSPYLGCSAGPGWTRGFDIHWNLPAAKQISALARSMEHLQVRASIASDDSLALLPGTHSAPPAIEDIAALVDSEGVTPGTVRVRVEPGDVLFWNTNVIHRMYGPDVNCFCVTFVSRNCPTPPWHQVQMGEPVGGGLEDSSR